MVVFKGDYYSRDGRVFYHFKVNRIKEIEEMNFPGKIIVNNELYFIDEREDTPIVVIISKNVSVAGENPFKTIEKFVNEFLDVVKEKIKNGEPFASEKINPIEVTLPTGEKLKAYLFTVE